MNGLTIFNNGLPIFNIINKQKYYKFKKKIAKFTLYKKLLLNKCVNVDHSINTYKQVKRCQLRYDK